MAAHLAEGSPAWARPYRSAHGRAVLFTTVLAVTIAFESLLLIFLAYPTLLLIFGSTDTFVRVTTGIAIVLGATAAVSFLFWFVRVYRNLPALGAQGLEWSPRSSVLWWFAPFLSFVVPLLITAEVWKASDPLDTENTAQTRRRARFPRLLIGWWIFWWCSRTLDRIFAKTDQIGIFFLLVILDTVAALLAIAVIWRIQLRQEEKAGQQGQQAAPMNDQGAPFPGPVATAAAPKSRGPRGLFLALAVGGICSVGLVVAAALVVAGFMRAAAECPSRDFPVYPDAQQTDFNYDFGQASTGCTADWESDASPEQVASFYDAGLAAGPWQLVSKDEKSGEWYFQRRDDSSTIGRIRFLAHGTQTRIEMEVMTGQGASSSTGP